MQITPDLHLISLSIVNAFVIVDEGEITLIDSGLPKNEKKILKYVESIGRKPSDHNHMLITHSDGDHIGSAKALRELTGAKIYASAFEAE